MTESVIVLEDVWAHYDDTPVLENVNLSVAREDFLGIIGPNGGGKTTLLKVILGLIKPTTGTVRILGNPPEKGRQKIGYVSQSNLFDKNFPISVLDVVLMGCYGKAGIFKRYSDEDKNKARESLHTVGMLEYRDRQIGKLSGGELQRVFIARALATDPRILLLDEPTASIDPGVQTGFYELLEKLRQRMTIIMVSHDISAVSVYVSKIACLNRRLYYHGTHEITPEILEATYKCPVQMIAHGTIPHRILKEH